MPYTAPHRLLTFFGDAWSQQEIWQFGFRLATADSETPATTAQMDTVIAAAHTWINSTSFSAHARFLGVKVAPQDVDGHYPNGQDAVERLRSSPTTGTGASGVPQITLCVSTTTSRTRGVGSKGRFYPPAAAMTPDGNGRIGNILQSTYMNGAIALINAVNGSGLGTVSVMSKGTPNGEPSTLPVTGVRVGAVLDTQRRRRNQLTELYISGAVNPT